ncbi:Flp family type IVb pilin [Celerinatantimonas sp. YJH-8]|uniref:Flp family type IVb pilin n=1 Tax=Celerinatantimonas sp. YJH-8 TaxID=3228714 RepID=UPI0038C51805
MLDLITLGYIKTKLAVSSFVKDQRGVTAIEYAIVAVAVAAIVAAVFGRNGQLYSALTSAFGKVSSTIDSVGSVASGS